VSRERTIGGAPYRRERERPSADDLEHAREQVTGRREPRLTDALTALPGAVLLADGVLWMPLDHSASGPGRPLRRQTTAGPP
jgi:hypothetical protein